MKIELKDITLRELSKNYLDMADGGVRGYDGLLDIRPPYQREFVYNGKQRDAVIDTASRGFPLNVMYWAVREDGTFEIIDGQQRTISLCQFISGDFGVKIGSFPEKRAFHNLQNDEQERLLDYKLTVYLCSGSDSEKLEWFRTINIAGEKLYEQELRNAVFHGPWLTDAKRYFSKPNSPAQAVGSKYLSGSAIRQDYLETAIEWAADGGDIERYMSIHQKETSAKPLWDYVEAVLDWTKAGFPKYRSEMKGVPWGLIYNKWKDTPIDPVAMEQRVAALMEDDEITSKPGIYRFVFDGRESHLSIRKFTDKHKREAFERQRGVCPVCAKIFDINDMEADHITPWHSGGRTVPENCQMLCKEDNRRKSGI